MTRRRKILLICCGIIVIVIANVVVQVYISLSSDNICRRIRRVARERLGCSVEVASARASLLGLIELKGIRLALPEGESDEPFLAIDHIVLDCSPLRLLLGMSGVDEIEIAGPRVKLNDKVIGLLKKLAAGTDSAGNGRISKKISIFSGEVGIDAGILYAGSPALELTDLRIVLQATSYSASQLTFSGGATEPRFGAVQVTGHIDLASKGLSLKAEVPDLQIDDRFQKLLPSAALEVWNDIDPAGRADVAVKLDYKWGEEKSFRQTITATVTDASVRIKEFPLLLAGARGLLESDGKTLIVKRAIAPYKGGTVEVRRGFVDKDITEFEVIARALPITPEVKAALPADARSVFDDFNISGGEADGIYRLTLHKGGPESFPEHSLHLMVSDVSASFNDFPYPVERIGGRFRWVTPKQHEKTPSLIYLNLKGVAGQGTVEVDGLIPLPPIVGPRGQVPYVNGGESPDLTITARRIELDDRLRKAVPPEVAEIIDALSPVGNVDATVMLKLKHDGEKMVITSRAAVIQLNGITATFDQFPYPVTNLVGRVEWDGSTVKLAGLIGLCGEARVSVTGELTLGDEAPEAGEKQGITISVEGLELNARLREALDDETRETWDDFAPSGRINALVLVGLDADGKMNVQKITLNLDHCRATYKGFPYPLESLTGRVKITGDTTTLENIAGRAGVGDVRLAGRFVNAQTAEGTQENPASENSTLNIRARNIVFDEALMQAVPKAWAEIWDKVQPKGSFGGELNVIMPAKGPATIAEGSSLRTRGVSLKGIPLPEATFSLTMDERFVHITKFTGAYYGGQIKGNLHLGRNDDKWLTHIGVYNLDIKQINDERRFMDDPIRGQLTATVDLAGEGAQTNKLTGNAKVEVHNGELGHIPKLADVFMSLLSLGLPKSNTITGADVECKIAEGKVDFSKILFMGTTVPITGDGFVKFDGEMLLNFFTSKDRKSIFGIIPFIGKLVDRELIARLRNFMIQVKVEGTYPDVTPTPVTFGSVGNVLLAPVELFLDIFTAEEKEKKK